jgi:hypothetical protein
VVGTGGPAQAGSPDGWRKHHNRQQEESAGNFEPQDAAHSPEWPEQAANALRHTAAGLSNSSPGLRGLPAAGNLNTSACSHLRSGWRGCGGSDALPCHASGYPDSDAQHPPDVFRLHSVYDGNSDPAYAAFSTRAGLRCLPGDRIRRKVKRLCVAPALAVRAGRRRWR